MILSQGLLALTLRAVVMAAETAQPAPVFRPGLYETESRDASSQARGERRTGCVAFSDYDTFRRETIARFVQLPQFDRVCHLSRDRPIADGFALAMDCGSAQTVIAYRFSKDLVSSTTQTKVATRPEYSSTVLTLSRRIGPCEPSAPARR